MNTPVPFRTRRLLIRGPRPDDARAIHEAIVESVERLLPWMPWAQPSPLLSDTEAFIHRALESAEAQTEFPMLLFHRESGRYVGGSGFHRLEWSVPRFEIGYWCRTAFEGQGLITEAVRGMAAMAFERLGANRVEIRMDSRNIRSARVAERAGFFREGEMRNNGRATDGSLRNTLVFSLIPNEYRELRARNPEAFHIELGDAV